MHNDSNMSFIKNIKINTDDRVIKGGKKMGKDLSLSHQVNLLIL